MANLSSYMAIALLLAAAFSTSLTAANAEGEMTKKTNRGSLDIMLEPTWVDGGQAKFKISFLDPNTNTLHLHQDWNARILKGSTEAFNTGVQHNVEGTVTIPYDFKGGMGDYTLEVNVLGACFPSSPETSSCPINEKAVFDLTVTPEFPVGVIGAVLASLTAATIVLSRKLHLGIRI